MEILQSGLINTTVGMLAEESMADRLQKASLNTLLGMGTVFAVLILISLVISTFKLIPYLENKMSKKNQVASPVDNVIAQIVEQEEEELIDDFELVAVITAAIYAALGDTTLGDTVPADGLIVRSIRKVNSKRWMNA